MPLSEEEYETFKQINDYLIDEGIDRFFPKFKDMLQRSSGYFPTKKSKILYKNPYFSA